MTDQDWKYVEDLLDQMHNVILHKMKEIAKRRKDAKVQPWIVTGKPPRT